MDKGEKLPKQPQRKLTTILAADVVGYSRMMGADEDGTYELLGKCRKIIDRNIEHHGGRIFNTAGDSVMAEFSSTVEAVRCAIEIQEEINAHNEGKPESRQMWFRIGLNVGDVIIEGDNLIGEGVNIASRMESIAPPSGICISGSVYELVRNKLSFTFEDMGRKSVKNIVEPIAAYGLRPTATPKIEAVTTKDRLKSRYAKKRIKRFLILGAIAFVLLVIAGKDKERKEAARLQEAKSDQKAVLQEADRGGGSASKSITPSLFAGRTIRGVAGKTGDFFTIKMDEGGDAAVTAYKKDKPFRPFKTLSGKWWIDRDGRLCFGVEHFNRGENFCRTYVSLGEHELLVANDPAKPKWELLPR